MPDSPAAARAVELLVRYGAAHVPHPGGTLHSHLTRVHARLSNWGARPALRLAGLCHAFYELDIARVDPEFRQRWGPDLLALFTRLRHLLSDRAWADCREVLGTAG